MRLLLDTCVWRGARDALVEFGHDVIWCGDWPRDPGDEEILSAANHDSRVLVTLDKDFGELAVLRRQPHMGIVRLVNWRASDQGAACRAIVARYAAELRSGAIVTAEPGRVRIRLSS